MNLLITLLFYSHIYIMHDVTDQMSFDIDYVNRDQEPIDFPNQGPEGLLWF